MTPRQYGTTFENHHDDAVTTFNKLHFGVGCAIGYVITVVMVL